ncbi:hypothetical protein D3C84_521980 [compost metagenome]
MALADAVDVQGGPASVALDDVQFEGLCGDFNPVRFTWYRVQLHRPVPILQADAIVQRHTGVVAPAGERGGMSLRRSLIKQRRRNRQFFSTRVMRMQTRMVGEMRRDEPGAELATDEAWMFQQAGKQALIARQAQQHTVLHRAQQLAPGFFTGRAVGDDLAQHRVIERADVLTFDQPMVDPRSTLQGRFPGGDAPGLWEEPLGRVFGIQPHFHGVAVELHLFLAQWQR